jgi:hypothetical protein
LHQRFGACVVVTAAHVLKDAIASGSTAQVVADGRIAPMRLDNATTVQRADLIYATVSDPTLCQAGSAGEFLRQVSARTIDEAIKAGAGSALEIADIKGITSRIPVVLNASGDPAVLDVLSTSTANQYALKEGYSGAIGRSAAGDPIGMLTQVDVSSNLGKALRFDRVVDLLTDSLIAPPSGPARCASTMTVDVPQGSRVKLSQLSGAVRSGPVDVTKIVDTLKGLPTVHVGGVLEVDVDATLIACRINLDSSGRVERHDRKPLRLLSLEINANAGAVIDASGADGASANGTAGPGGPGSNFGASTGGRRGCDATVHGGAGGQGQPGAPGQAGSAGGDVSIVTAEIIGPLLVRSNGGHGGNGQQGGPGGPGGNGLGASSGSSNAFNCNCGGNPGGRGGDGGMGGPGGNAGAGGNTGRIYALLAMPAPTTMTFERKPGLPGNPGPGGPSGHPGSGGGGEGQNGWCSPQRSGDGGLQGQTGVSGQGAPSGQNAPDGAAVAMTTINARIDWVSWLVDAANLTRATP